MGRLFFSFPWQNFLSLALKHLLQEEVAPRHLKLAWGWTVMDSHLQPFLPLQAGLCWMENEKKFDHQDPLRDEWQLDSTTCRELGLPLAPALWSLQAPSWLKAGLNHLSIQHRDAASPLPSDLICTSRCWQNFQACLHTPWIWARCLAGPARAGFVSARSPSCLLCGVLCHPQCHLTTPPSCVCPRLRYFT